MTKFLLALLVSISAQAASPSGVPSVTVSAPGANTGQVTIAPSDLSKATSPIFSLYGFVLSATADNFYALYRNGGSQYRVGDQTGSYGTVKAYCFDITASASGASRYFQLASATAAFNAVAVGSLTGPIYQGGATTNYVVITGPTGSVPTVVPGVYVFPASAYAGYQVQTATSTYNVHLDCFEQ